MDELEKIVKHNFFEANDKELEAYLKLCCNYKDLIDRIEWKLFHVCEKERHKMIIENGVIKCKRCGRDITRW